MTRIDPATAVLSFAVSPLGRGEASSLVRTAPAGRATRIGRWPVTAIGHAAAVPVANRFIPLFADAPGETPRIATSADSRSLPDRLRDLADDAKAVAAELDPSAADPACAPLHDGWVFDVAATRCSASGLGTPGLRQ